MPTRARSCTTSCFLSWMSLPSSRMEPTTRALGIVSFMRFRQRRNVDLPQPEGPIIASTWFFAMSMPTFLMACFSP